MKLNASKQEFEIVERRKGEVRVKMKGSRHESDWIKEDDLVRTSDYKPESGEKPAETEQPDLGYFGYLI